MSEIAEKVVVITGASSGIGEATARLLAKRGACPRSVGTRWWLRAPFTVLPSSPWERAPKDCVRKAERTSITDPDAQKGMEDFRSQAIPAAAIARSIAYAIEQPAEVAVSEIIVRPTGGY